MMNYLTRPLDLASQLMNLGNRRNLEVKSKVSPVPSASAIRQWGVKAQENLAHHQKTGELPKNIFLFD